MRSPPAQSKVQFKENNFRVADALLLQQKFNTGKIEINEIEKNGSAFIQINFTNYSNTGYVSTNHTPRNQQAMVYIRTFGECELYFTSNNKPASDRAKNAMWVSTASTHYSIVTIKKEFYEEMIKELNKREDKIPPRTIDQAFKDIFPDYENNNTSENLEDSPIKLSPLEKVELTSAKTMSKP